MIFGVGLRNAEEHVGSPNALAVDRACPLTFLLFCITQDFSLVERFP